MRKLILFVFFFISIKAFSQSQIGNYPLNSAPRDTDRVAIWQGWNCYNNGNSCTRGWPLDSIPEWLKRKGFINGVANLSGTGIGIYKNTASGTANFKRLKAGSGITITDNTDSVTIAASGGSGWSITGNSGTNPATDFVGTTDAQSLNIRSKNKILATFDATINSIYLFDTNGVANLSLEPSIGQYLIGNPSQSFVQIHDNQNETTVASDSVLLTANSQNDTLTIKYESGAFRIYSPDGDTIIIGSSSLKVSPTGKTVVDSFQVTGGSPGSNKVLTSDASGNASWQALSAVTSVTASSPLSSSGGATPNITIDSTRLVRTDTITLSSAEILNSNSSPITIIPAPGANKYVSILGADLIYNYGGIAYSFGGYFGIIQGGDFIYYDATAVGVASSSFAMKMADGQLGGFFQTFTTNSPVQAYSDIGNPTTGNGTLKIVVTYKIISTN